MYSDVKARPPLPRGRHKLSREAVLASQRERLIAAMLERVAEHGYGRTTVTDVVSTARVSRNAFYELFADKQDCFLAATEESGRELLARLYAEAVRPTWTEAVWAGLEAYLSAWQDRPAFARAYLVELPSAGRPAQDQRDRVYEGFRELFSALAKRARAEQPGLPPLPRLAPRLLVIAITELIAEEVRAGRGDRLGELAPDLFAFIVTTLADEETAARASRRR